MEKVFDLQANEVEKSKKKTKKKGKKKGKKKREKNNILHYFSQYY